MKKIIASPCNLNFSKNMTSYFTNNLRANQNSKNIQKKTERPLSFYITQDEKKEVMTKNEIDDLRDSVGQKITI